MSHIWFINEIMETKNGTRNVKISNKLHGRARVQAAMSGKKIYEVVEEALIIYLASVGETVKPATNTNQPDSENCAV